MTGFIHSSLLATEQNSPSTSTMRMEIRGTAFFHSPRAGIEFQGQQSLPPPPPSLYSFARRERHSCTETLPPVSHTRPKKKKKGAERDGQYPLDRDQEQRPTSVPDSFSILSSPDLSHFYPSSPLPLSLSSPFLENSCTLVKSRGFVVRLHRTAK